MKSGILIKFPLDKTVDNFLFGVSKSTKDALKSKLLFLFYTEVGERYYKPDFGVATRKFLFDPNDDIILEEIQNEFKSKVSKYIPQVTIGGFSFGDVEEDRDLNKVVITIPFKYSEDAYSFSDTLKIIFDNNTN